MTTSRPTEPSQLVLFDRGLPDFSIPTKEEAKSKSLFDAHLTDLKASGITRETALEAGLHSADAQDLARLLGFSIPQNTNGLVFPYSGKGGYFRVKLFPPLSTDNGTMRYAQPKGSEVSLYIPPLTDPSLKNPAAELFITEGEKKALKACQEGLPTLAIGGLWNWMHDHEPISDLNDVAWMERPVTIVPDSDVWAREDLRKAVYALGKDLEKRGAKVSVRIIPPDGEKKLGLDDYLASHNLKAFLALKEIPLTHKGFTSEREWHKEWIKKRGGPAQDAGTTTTKRTAVFQGLVDIVRGEDGKPGFLILSQGHLDMVQDYEEDGITYQPPPQESMKWLLPRGEEVAKYFKHDTDRALYRDLVEYHKSISQLPSDDHYHLLAIWDFHTYLFENGAYSPYIWLYAVPERGKTRTGKGCIYVAWRGLHVESLRDAYLVRVAENLKCTIFFDVLSIWNKAQKHSTEDILLLRYEKGATVPRVLYPDRGPHEDTVYFNIFGPTLIATNETVGEILATRAVQIIMPESDREFSADPKPEDGLPLKERLTAFRARNLDKSLPEADKPCRGRLGDILRPLRQIVKLVAPEEEERFLSLCTALQRKKYDDLADSLEGRIIQKMMGLACEIQHGLLAAQTLTNSVNEGSPERFHLKQGKITRCCKRMGFRTARPGGKTHVVIDPELLQRLAVRYLGKDAPNAQNAKSEETQALTKRSSLSQNGDSGTKCTGEAEIMHGTNGRNDTDCADCAKRADDQSMGNQDDQKQEEYSI